jgi:hypothetical protein
MIKKYHKLITGLPLLHFHTCLNLDFIHVFIVEKLYMFVVAGGIVETNFLFNHDPSNCVEITFIMLFFSFYYLKILSKNCNEIIPW